MPQASGAKSRVIGITETTYNTVPGVPDGELLNFQSFNVVPSAERGQDPTISGYRGQPRGVLGRQNVAGSVVVTVAPQSIGWWLKHLIGAPTVAGTGPYTHSFAYGDANPLPAGITFETDYSAAITGAGRYLVQSGCRINQATFAFQTGTPFQTATFEILGASFDADNVGGHSGWGVSNITMELDDGATEVCIETLNVVFGNDLDDSLFCVSAGGVRHGLPEGFAIVTGNGAALFDTAALMNKALADADLKVVVTLSRGDGLGTAGNESLVLTIPLSSLDQTAPPIEGPRGLRLPFNFVAHRGTGELGVTAVLKNARATVG
jgi:hypothetical protein